MNITVIGTGFVGVVSAAVYASLGHRVMGLDIDERKIESLRASTVPFFEPDLEDLLRSQQSGGNLQFTTQYQEAIGDAEVIIIAVGTPSSPEGGADMRFILAAAESLAPYLSENAIVVVKSTVPPGTLNTVREAIQKHTTTPFHLASLPEFLREGQAVQDTLHPDRVVIGVDDDQVFETLRKLHEPFQAPILKVSPESAQMAKYAANAYLATRITFINQIADLCEYNGADVQEVIDCIGWDKRIGSHYWYPGFGYGGSCFPKDVKEIAHYSRQVGEEHNLFNKISELNEGRIPRLLSNYAQTIGGWPGKKVAVLGLSFKPNTDDMREAPSTKVIPFLLENQAVVAGYDPQALETAQQALVTHPHLSFYSSIESAVAEADVIIALIEWKQITSFDFGRTKLTKKQYFIDARNQFSPSKIVNWGYHYQGIGRPHAN